MANIEAHFLREELEKVKADLLAERKAANEMIANLYDSRDKAIEERDDAVARLQSAEQERAEALTQVERAAITLIKLRAVVVAADEIRGRLHGHWSPADIRFVEAYDRARAALTPPEGGDCK